MENQWFELTKDSLGLPKDRYPETIDTDLDALVAYVSSLSEAPKSPYRLNNGSLSQLAKQGQIIFDQLDCSQCHRAPTFTDGFRHDVGTIQPSSGQGQKTDLANIGFDTPTLKGLWNSFPYFHNGSATTLDEVLVTPGHGNGQNLTLEDREALIEYLNSLIK